MNPETSNAFESIEDAHEFLTLLSQTISETKLEVKTDIQRESTANAPRRLDALRITYYTLLKLDLHMSRSRRALNDLRTLRRLLFEEREQNKASIAAA